MEIDNEIFQMVTLALLGVTLLVLLVTLLSVSRLSKRLDRVSAARAEERPGPSGWDEEAARGEEPTAREPQPAGEAAAPQAATATVPAQIEPEQAAAAEAAGAPARVEEPAGAEVAAPEPEPAPASSTTGFEDAPEEQPFEREGRWWFKRGDELLVYDEGTGQWVPAPAEAQAGAAPPAVSGAGDRGSGESRGGRGEPAQAQSRPEQAEETQAAQPEPSGGYWKCPSCGAVNGSTATACRMCFTPRA